MEREKISALADNELSPEEADALLALLVVRDGDNDERACWDIYQQIGDVLRSSELAQPMRPTFAAEMAARLEAEPEIVAPAAAAALLQVGGPSPMISSGPVKQKRYGIKVAVAAALAALVLSPQFMQSIQNEAPQQAAHHPAQSSIIAASAPVVVRQQEMIIMRDPQIDEYLMAHQQYSPAMHNNTQYMRSVNVAPVGGK